MNAPIHIAAERRVPDPRIVSDLSRLDRCIAALQAARKAASAGTFFVSMDGLVAIEAMRRMCQSDDLDTLYGEIWSEAGCPISDEVDDALRALSFNERIGEAA